MSIVPTLETPRPYRPLGHGKEDLAVNAALLRRVLTLHGVPPRTLVLAALASFAVQMLAIIQGGPLWAIGLATLIPLTPVVGLQVAWVYHHYRWLALFYALVLTQVGHCVEHVAQVTQIHLLGLHGGHAHGIFGALDVEWVHFLWNTWIGLALLLLLARFRTNPWLWMTLLIAGWHGLEHGYIIWTYLTTGISGSPGLLSKGGAIGGGLPLIRPDLHFLYNLVETAPLLVAFVYQLKRSHGRHS